MRLVLFAMLLGACHRPTAGPSGGFVVPLTADAPPGDEVIATVDGRPIRASAVAAQAKAARSTAKQALDDLVTAEVLAGEAVRRKLDRDRDALELARAESVRRLLATTFEKEVTPEQISDRAVQRTYKQHVNQFDHSTYIDVWHILVPVPAGATPEQKSAARTLAEEIAKRAKGVPSAELFRAIAKEVTRPAGIGELKVEQIVTARDGWVLPTFSHPAFDQLHQPGDTSTVVETTYGFHVLYLNGFVPAIHETVAEAAPKVRAGLFPSFQQAEFLRLTDEAKKHHDVVTHPERIK